MTITRLGKIAHGQDGAIFGTELFRMDEKGHCTVYELGGDAPVETGKFTLDRADEIAPHSNAVCFGAERYAEKDPYPLLYTNIYNNYAGAENKRIGECLVYRIQRTKEGFASTLVQIIAIGFCEDAALWKASPEGHGVRPFGNFVVDPEEGAYWAFVMRNEALGTRYFRFALPRAHDGEEDALGIRRVVLTKEDVQDSFDCEYHRYIQGAILKGGRIYSTEGFDNDTVNRPAIRIVDLQKKTAEYHDITALGYFEEPECIDFLGERCLYSDAVGNLYEITF